MLVSLIFFTNFETMKQAFQNIKISIENKSFLIKAKNNEEKIIFHVMFLFQKIIINQKPIKTVLNNYKWLMKINQ
jgi:mRNA-degrading endonuclease HigB of HigAB toxin-antitoxin module